MVPWFFEFTQGFYDDGGGRDCEGSRKENAVHGIPAEDAANFVPKPHHQQDFEERSYECGRTDLLELAQAELEPRPNISRITPSSASVLMSSRCRGSIRRAACVADDNACDDVPRTNRLFEIDGRDRDQSGNGQHYREVLEEITAVHCCCRCGQAADGNRSREAGESHGRPGPEHFS